MPQPKIEKSRSLSKKELRNLKRLYTQVGAAYGSVRNLVKASPLPVSRARQFLRSKPSYKKFPLATRKSKSLKASSRFKSGIWCTDLSSAEKLVKDVNGMKYPLVRQDLFDRAVDAKGKKTKDSKERVRAVSGKITKKNRPKKILG